MIVNQFNTFPYGGAGAAAMRHHLELRQQGIDSRFYHRADAESIATDCSIQPLPLQPPSSPTGFLDKRRDKLRRRKIIRQYERHLKGGMARGELFSQPESIDPTRLPDDWTWGNLAHLHWVSFLFDWPSFFAAMPTELPVVWTLHDMNPFTGGCHYSAGCGRFVSGCGQCPAVPHAGPNDLSHDAIRIKRRALLGRKIQVVTPSEWLGRLARQSPVWPEQTEFRVIPYGVNVQQFRPIEKSFARRKLGLPQNVALIAFGADDLDNPRKGFHLLLKSLRMLSTEQPVECIVFGRGRLPENREGLPIIHELGFVDGWERQANVYSAADVMVLPSLEDNSPQTGLEAMACGTPVVAFDAGGIPEFVRPGQTGLLAAVGNVAELGKQLGDLIDHHRLRQRFAACSRKLIESEHDIRKQAHKYIELYCSLTGIPHADPHRRAA